MLMGSKNEALTVRKKQLTTPDWRGTMMRRVELHEVVVSLSVEITRKHF